MDWLPSNMLLRVILIIFAIMFWPLGLFLLVLYLIDRHSFNIANSINKAQQQDIEIKKMKQEIKELKENNKIKKE